MYNHVFNIDVSPQQNEAVERQSPMVGFSALEKTKHRTVGEEKTKHRLSGFNNVLKR